MADRTQNVASYFLVVLLVALIGWALMHAGTPTATLMPGATGPSPTAPEVSSVIDPNATPVLTDDPNSALVKPSDRTSLGNPDNPDVPTNGGSTEGWK